MDVLYLFRSSPYADEELRYSLRSVERHAPWVRRAFVLGDRPRFLKASDRVVHVDYATLTPQLGLKAPCSNFFLMLLLGSLIPEMDYEFLFFCDDFILLDDLDETTAREDRYLQDLSDAKERGTGLWKDSLWRTYDLLKRLGYPTLNFETHVPTYFNRRRVWDAYGSFKDFVTEDRWFGLLGPTAILNHAMQRERPKPRRIGSEDRAGFWGRGPTAQELIAACEGRKFLNFDDGAFNQEIAEFLRRRFPVPAPWEREGGLGPVAPAAGKWFTVEA